MASLRKIAVVGGLVSLVIGIAFWSAPLVAADAPPDGLISGGFVLLVRHATTDRTQRDASAVDLNNCATQRNINDKGRAEAQEIGTAVRRLNIPVGRVLAGPYCRTKETASLAFGQVELSDTLVAAGYEPVPGAPVPPPAPQRLEALKKLLSTAPAQGTNTVLVTHSEVIRNTVSLDAAEGETLIFKPDGQGSFGLVGRVLAADWSAALGGVPAQLPRDGDNLSWFGEIAILSGAALLTTGVGLRFVFVEK